MALKFNPTTGELDLVTAAANLITGTEAEILALSPTGLGLAVNTDDGAPYYLYIWTGSTWLRVLLGEIVVASEFLLVENGDFRLLENGDKLILG